MRKSPLSIDVLAIGTEAQAAYVIVKKWMSDNMNNRLPCVVEAVDEAENTVVVRPLVMMTTTSGETISRGEKHNIQIFTMGTGRAFMKFKVEVGDVGWIESSDKNYAKVIQAIKSDQAIIEHGGETFINFNWSSARFTADYMKPYNTTADMYFGNKDGTVSTTFGPGEVMALTAGTGGHEGIARLNDTVEVTIPAGSLGTTDVSSTPIPPADVIVTGKITSSSTTITAN